jgi:hypothetical protein
VAHLVFLASYEISTNFIICAAFTSKNLTFVLSVIYIGNRHSSVGTQTEYKLHDRGMEVRFPRNFSNFHGIRTNSGAHHASYLMGIRGPFVGSKMAGETDLSPSYTVEIMNARTRTSTPPYTFMVYRLIKQKNNFNSFVMYIYKVPVNNIVHTVLACLISANIIHNNILLVMITVSISPNLT